jgi:hypothetical protein
MLKMLIFLDGLSTFFPLLRFSEIEHLLCSSDDVQKDKDQ